MPKAEVSALFPTPFMRVHGLLGPTQVAKLASGLDQNLSEANNKSPLLAHTPVVAPAEHPLYQQLNTQLLPILTEFGSLLFGEALPWVIKEMWMNALEPGGQQALHSHANSFISGVLYLSECHPGARTLFYRGLGGRDFTFHNDGPNVQQGPFNSPKWAVPQVNPGDLVLFPSSLLHEVPPNPGKRRLTLAFNALPKRLRSWNYEVHLS